MAMTAALETSLSQFTTSLYDKVVQQQGNNLENVIVSPMSIYVAFMVVMVGADGYTKEEMMTALQLPETLRGSCLHERIGPVLTKIFQSTSDIDLSLANRLFLFHQIKLKDRFNQIVQKNYQAEAELLTTLPDVEAKRKRVNDWVSEQTRDKIKDLIPPGGISSDTELALINALYFRGAWNVAFDKAMTRSADFHCLDGSKTKVQMMHKEAKYLLLRLADENAQALKIPFKGSDWELLIILPNEKNGLHNLVNELRKPGKLASILSSQFRNVTVDLRLPRFKVEDKTPLDLKPFLVSMGMKSLFSASADLSKLSREKRLSISGAFHKAMLEVDEEGATAAASTGIFAVTLSLVYNPVFRVDHPFFVALIHGRTVPVFVGHVTNPESH